MPRYKPIVPPVQPLGSSKDHYKLTGQPYKTNTLKIKWTLLKTLGIVILLIIFYAGLILMVYSSGLKVLAAIMIGTALLIGGSIALLYYLNREEPVKPPSNQKKRH
jgi:lipid-A-disaccharide synthase-like uncharacterized protein